VIAKLVSEQTKQTFLRRKRMKTMMKTALAVMTIAALSACGGGGGGGSVSTGGTYMTHEQLAQEFVRRVNVDVKGYNLTLAKTNTLQYSYIVVYDQDYKSYDAYWLGSYNVGENIANYLNKNQNMFYYDLIPEGVNNYRDYVTGKVFELDSDSSMDLDQIAAVKQMAAIKHAARDLREKYGMSEESSLDTARFAYQIQNAPAGSFDAQSFDLFAKGLTGSSITEFQKDIKAGNTASLSSRLETAKEMTGMPAEGVAALMSDVFGK